MTATMEVMRYTGSAGGPTKTDVTGANSRHVTVDTHYSGGVASPVPLSSNGYWVTYRMEAITTPATSASGLLVWTDGTSQLGTGVTVMGQSADSYVQATGTAGVSGTQLTTGNHAGLTGNPVDVFTLTSGTPMSLTGSISNPSTGAWGQFFVYQVALPSTLPTGSPSAETLTYFWDET